MALETDKTERKKKNRENPQAASNPTRKNI